MWRRHLLKIVSAVLTFSLLINKGYSDHAVLSDCHVTINVSTWSLYGSCLMSSTSGQYECYWILKQNRGQDDIILTTVKNQSNKDQNMSGICLFSFSIPKQEGEYRFYILSKPQPTNPYSFDMLINRTNEAHIVESTFWVENDVKFGKFTCNASSYFQDVLYIWTVPCQKELIIDKTSECSTSLTDQKTEITCIAINASTSMSVFHEGSSQSSDKKLPKSVLIGCTVGILAILSLSVGITVYFKHRKGSSTEDVTRNSTSTSLRVNNFCNSRQEQHPGSSNDFHPASDKSTLRRQEWDSGQNTHLKLSTMIKKPVEISVLSEKRETLEESVKIDKSLYENIATSSIKKATDAVDFRQPESFRKSQKETRPQSDTHASLYNRLSFFTHRRPRSVATQFESAYNHIEHH